MKNPLVSVVMPVFNAEMYLHAAVSSILSQSHQNLELIVIDDGSSDKSSEILSSFDDKRLRIYKNDYNRGLSFSLNRGLDLSDGDFIARMDADDISHPRRLEIQLAFLLKNYDIAILGSWAKKINSNGKVIGRIKPSTEDKTIAWRHLFAGQFIHPTVMMRRDALALSSLRYGSLPHWAVGADKDFYIHSISEDHLFFGMALLKLKVANLPQYLLSYRVHEASVSSLNCAKQQSNGAALLNIFARELGCKFSSKLSAETLYHTKRKESLSNNVEDLILLDFDSLWHSFKSYHHLEGISSDMPPYRDYRLRRGLISHSSASLMKRLKLLISEGFWPADREEIRLVLNLLSPSLFNYAKKMLLRR